jgi:hypothetical protein
MSYLIHFLSFLIQAEDPSSFLQETPSQSVGNTSGTYALIQEAFTGNIKKTNRTAPRLLFLLPNSVLLSTYILSRYSKKFCSGTSVWLFQDPTSIVVDLCAQSTLQKIGAFIVQNYIQYHYYFEPSKPINPKQ